MRQFQLRSMAAVLGVLSGLMMFGGSASAEKRVALVVGNNAYPNLPANMQLRNAISDARAVRDALKGLGFDVFYGENLDRNALVNRTFDLASRLSPGDTAFFFFAGHGVSFSGANYLLPTDVPAPRGSGRAEEGRLADLALAETQVIERITASAARVAIVVLDACRDNPLQAADRRSIGYTRGLAQTAPPRGVFSIYSAGFGQAALDRLGPDDRHPNSVFTRVFVDKLKTPGIDLKVVATETRRAVAALAEKAGHEQFPAYYDQIVGGDVYLAGLPQAAAPVVATPGPQQDKGAQDPAARERKKEERAREQSRLQEERRRAEDEARRRHEDERAKAEAERKKLAVVAPPVVPPAPERVKPAVGVFPQVGSTRSLTPEQERALSPKDTFKECDVCPEMVVVPSGSFVMGSPPNEPGREASEGPQHKVTFAREFAVGRFAVTFDEWDACVADGGCDGYKPGDKNFGRGNRPVINISWKHARSYAAWLSRKTARTYRLLSEAEREYVTRAGTTVPYWFGATISSREANFNALIPGPGSARGSISDKTVPVDRFAPNPWGLYQVHGNVQEWVEDCWNGNYRGAPTDGSAWTKGDCKRRVLRGGGFDGLWEYLRSAHRHRQEIDIALYTYGFRVARTLAR